MRKELEELWENYLVEVPMERTEEEKRYISEYSKISALFRSKLNEEQKKYLEECMRNGAEFATKLSQRTLDKVMKKVGFLPR